MDEFLKEIKAMSASDLQLIVEDQRDLYSEEEFQMILNELESRGKNAIAVEKAEWDRQIKEEARKEEAAEKAAKKAALEEQRRKEEELQQIMAQRIEELSEKMPQLRAEFLCTTGFNFDGYKITNYIGIKSGESVLGTGLLSDLSATLTDFFGVESSVVGMKLGQAKEKALASLIDRCIIAGANAAIGIDLDIMTYGPNMMVACANGTAVTIEKI